LISLTYASRSPKPFTGDELRALLEQSRTNNERRGLTGILLHKDGQFMQVLEGDDETVMSVYETIGADPRHSVLRTLLKEPIDERQFGEWTMAFREVDAETDELVGFNPFFAERRDAGAVAASASRARMLLDWFRTRSF